MTDHFGFDSTGACHDCARGWCFSHATYTAAGAWGQIDTTPLPSLPWPTSKAPESGPGNMHGWLRDQCPTTEEAMELVIASLGYLPMLDWGR